MNNQKLDKFINSVIQESEREEMRELLDNINADIEKERARQRAFIEGIEKEHLFKDKQEPDPADLPNDADYAYKHLSKKLRESFLNH